MLVFPGDFLGYAEEFICDDGVYSEEGKLYASKAGRVKIKNKVIKVETINEIPKISKGDIVLGEVIDTKNNFALVEIVRKKGFNRELTTYKTAVLHISNISTMYLKDINEGIRYKDIIVCEVIDDDLKLSTKKDELGVIKAKCGICGGELLLKGDKLRCKECGNTEKRKISKNYGKGVW